MVWFLFPFLVSFLPAFFLLPPEIGDIKMKFQNDKWLFDINVLKNLHITAKPVYYDHLLYCDLVFFIDRWFHYRWWLCIMSYIKLKTKNIISHVIFTASRPLVQYSLYSYYLHLLDVTHLWLTFAFRQLRYTVLTLFCLLSVPYLPWPPFSSHPPPSACRTHHKGGPRYSPHSQS